MTQPAKTPAAQRLNGVMPKPSPDVEVGVSAYLPFAVPYKNAWEALRDEEITVRQLVAMRKTDGQARALYRLITLPIRAALKTATWVPEDHVDGGEEEAQFIEQMFTMPASAGGMSVPFQKVIAQMLLSVFDGFTAFELVYWSPKVGPLKGKWTLKKLAHRPAETLSFVTDDRSEFAGFRQRTMFHGKTIDVHLPPEHCVYIAMNEEEKPFYGQSYFHSAYYHWDKKYKLYVVAHLAAQRAAVGTRIGKIPKNPNREEKSSFQRALAQIGVAQWMTMPEDYEVDSVKEGTGFDFLSLINHHNSQMSKSVLASFFDKEQGGGDSAKLVDFGTQSDALFMMMLQTIMSEVEEVINQHIIPRFIDWNFGSQKYPKFQFGSLTEEQKSALVDLFKTLSVAGQSLTISPEFVHELEKQVAEEFGLEIDYNAVEAEMAEQKDLARQQQELQMQGGGPGATGGDPAAAGGPSTPAAASPLVDPSLLPRGFTLSFDGSDVLELSDEAAALLAAAYEGLMLTRGVPTSGGPKRVQTPAGAKVYGVPVGTPITRDIAERTAKHGVKGKNFGSGIRDPKGGGKGEDHKSLGGGPGAAAQNPGGVANKASSVEPKAIYGHPKAPGAQLLDYGDGTVAIRDAHGVLSARQRFQIEEFIKLGWKAQRGDPAGKQVAAKAAGKPTT